MNKLIATLCRVVMRVFCLLVTFLPAAQMAHAQTPYGNCPAAAQSYQERYESSGQASDLVCYQKALEREMTGPAPYDCPLSAQRYQDAYTSEGRSSDLVCYQNALLREIQ